MSKSNVKKVVLSGVIAVILAIAVVASVFANHYWDYLMSVFGEVKTTTDETDVSPAQTLGDELVQEIGEESMVLLKNDNDALPLKEDERKVNLFGYSSTKRGFLYSGGGSSGTCINKVGYSLEDLDEFVVGPAEAFEQEGFEVNKELEKIYDYTHNAATVSHGDFELYNPPVTVYTRDVILQAKRFSELAVIVISRSASESSDIPLTQTKYNGKKVTDASRHFLQLTTEEEDMIEVVTNNFEKVIVLINSGNAMELGFLENPGIDAAFYVGMPGQSGLLAIPRLLKGYKTVEDKNGKEEKVSVTPSARLADTYAYSLREYNPTDANMWAYPHYYTGYGQISYTEGIYVGYKWYETADEEGYFDSVKNDYGTGYDGVVQYPFGYGLSYDTDFEYTVTSSLKNGSEIKADTEITITVNVKNVGKTAGKEVVQLYFTPQYYDGEIEKSSVNLVKFAKTTTLKQGTSQDITFTIRPYDLACYDDYNKNANGHAGYELDRGKYTLSLRANAHTLIYCENNQLNYQVASTINIDKDPDTGATVENRFTGESAYLGMPIDGSTAGGTPIKYLSRSDFKGTFPFNRTLDRSDKAAIKAVNEKRNDRYDVDTTPTTDQKNNLYSRRHERR